MATRRRRGAGTPVGRSGTKRHKSAANHEEELSKGQENDSDNDDDEESDDEVADEEKENRNHVTMDNHSTDHCNLVDGLRKRVRDLEAKLKVEQQKPPSMIVCKPGKERGIDPAALEKMAEHDAVLVNNLRLFAKKTVFPACKFLSNKNDAITLCRRAVRLRKVILPVGVSETDFCDYYQGKMKSLIDKFRNTTQCVARDNCMSKLSISFWPAAPHTKHTNGMLLLKKTQRTYKKGVFQITSLKHC